MMLCEGLEGEVGDFHLLKRSKSPFGRLGTAGSLQLVEIPTSKMAAGIYFVNVQQADKMLYSAKLSVTK